MCECAHMYCGVHVCYVCVHVFTCLCMSACVFTHLCMSAYVCCVCMSAHVFVFVHACLSVACMRICTHPMSRGSRPLCALGVGMRPEVGGTQVRADAASRAVRLTGGTGQAEAKDPINSCSRVGAGEGVFPEQGEE